MLFSHHNLIHLWYPAESAWSQKQDFIYFHFSKISRVLFFEMFLTFYIRLKRELFDSILTWCIISTFPIKQNLQRPGIEPGPPAWQARILPLNQRCLMTRTQNLFIYQNWLIKIAWSVYNPNRLVQFIKVNLYVTLYLKVPKQRWFSGRILACHAGGPGSIPGRCKFCKIVNRLVYFRLKST